jgi:hypothetical protein
VVCVSCKIYIINKAFNNLQESHLTILPQFPHRLNVEATSAIFTSPTHGGYPSLCLLAQRAENSRLHGYAQNHPNFFKRLSDRAFDICPQCEKDTDPNSPVTHVLEQCYAVEELRKSLYKQIEDQFLALTAVSILVVPNHKLEPSTDYLLLSTRGYVCAKHDNLTLKLFADLQTSLAKANTRILNQWRMNLPPLEE